MKLSSLEYDGFLADDALESPLTITKDQEKAKKFWITKDPLDNHKAMLHAMINGQDVITRKGNSELVYKRVSRDLEKDQYWSISMGSVLHGDKEYTRYRFFIDNMYWTYNQSNIFLEKKNETNKNQIFEIIHENGDRYFNPFNTNFLNVENEGASTNKSFSGFGMNENFNKNPWYYSPGYINTGFGSNKTFLITEPMDINMRI